VQRKVSLSEFSSSEKCNHSENIDNEISKNGETENRNE
jgi:hypothetical protein